MDISHTDIDKNSLYAAIGVPEFWRFNGQVWRIYQLQENVYVEVDCSPRFAMVAKEKLYGFLAVSQQNEVEAEINFRAWVREQKP